MAGKGKWRRFAVLTVSAGPIDTCMATNEALASRYLHELALTAPARVPRDADANRAWPANAQGVAYADSEAFALNERAMNSVMAALTSKAGYDPQSYHPNVAHGYETDWTVTGTGGSITPVTNGSGPR